MEEKYKRFQEYDWSKSQEWQNYYSNLFPTPPGNKIEHFKKKFYRLKVDNDFDVNFVPATNSSGNPTTNASNNNSSYTSSSFSNQYTAPTPTRIENKALATTEAFIWFLFLQSILFQFYTLPLAAIALVIRTYNRVGIIKFNMEYAQLLFLDEHFQLILYTLLFMIERFNYFILVPLIITALMNISYFLSRNSNLLPKYIIDFVKPYSEKLVNKRVELARTRSNVELAIGLLLVIGIFFGTNGFLIPIFYWQYIRFKYIVNEDTKAAFTRLNLIINKNKLKLPSAVQLGITKVQQFAEYLGRTEAQPGESAGGANCIIF